MPAHSPADDIHVSYRAYVDKNRIRCPECCNPVTVTTVPGDISVSRPKLSCGHCGYEAIGRFGRTGPVFPR